jgi:hypothetical protein
MNRLRPARSRPQQSVESILANYVRSVLRDNRQADPARSLITPANVDATETQLLDNFQAFLETLQNDLISAVQQFADPASVNRSSNDTVNPETPGTGDPPVSDSIVDSSASSTSALPTFHRQLGQTLPGQTDRSGITGGTGGEPRRLSFFRAHLFPSRAQIEGQETAEDDPNAIVPCIFLGVRSISHDPRMSTEDLVQHPMFPFTDGQVPANETSATEPGATEDPNAAGTEATPRARRSLRERVMERLAPRQIQEPEGPVQTFLLYVIGGNYPRSHPILAIPNLITGGPLTDEDMALISELMGPVKPPTATKEDIEKAGLRLVDGAEMKGLAERDELHHNCADRCLVSCYS